MTAWLVLLQATLTISVAGPATSPEYLPLRLAEAEGYFAQERLTVSLQTTRSESQAAEALARGQAQLAATSVDAALRLGHVAGAPPRLVFGLTEAPPVALLVPTAQKEAIRSLQNLAGKTVGIPSPGTAEHLMLLSLLAKAGLRLPQLTVQSYGDRRLASAMESGQVAAAVIGDPWATRLLEEGSAVALADFRKRGEASRWLGQPAVHAALFARADSTLGPTELAALARTLLKAIDRLRSATPDELATRLPSTAVGPPADFRLRVSGAREIFLPNGWVTEEMMAESVRLAQERAKLPSQVSVPRNKSRLLLLEPLGEALGPKRPR
ncbi:MAG TPA: ABC transporter substrate-binding protein [Methylomirabilota bacterium]|nr:ABC transporter substrate-binding protein [Methylomirabilota bacterium]